MDTWGWVADLINNGTVDATILLCPSNPLKGSEKVNDLYGKDTTDAKDGASANRLAAGVCGADSYNGVAGGGTTFGGTTALTEARAEVIARHFMEKGYNTNYAAGWHLVRTTPRLSPNSTSAATLIDENNGQKGVSGTVGPLTRVVAETAPMAASMIAVMGDAGPGDIDEAVMAADITYAGVGSATHATFAQNSTNERTFLRGGQLLTEAFNDGPATLDASSPAVVLIDKGADVTLQVAAERDGSIPAPANNGYYLQDTRDWFAIHGSGSAKVCNILFADGSVQAFKDTSGDGFLNPGFPVDAATAVPTTGYQDDAVELPKEKVFMGVFLIDTDKLVALED